jgi:hypothetical protein
MGKIAGLGLLLVSVSAVIGVDYQAALKGKSADSYGLTDHLSARVAGLKTIASSVIPASGLDAMMPPAPAGWTVRAAKMEDSFIVMGKPEDKAQLDLMNKIEDATYGAMSGERRARSFYQSGDKVVMLEILFIPAKAVPSDGARRMDLFMGLLEGQSDTTGESLAPGLDLLRLTAAGLGDSTFHMARAGRQVYVTMSSNTSEDEALTLMRGVDAAGLMKLAADDPGPTDVAPINMPVMAAARAAAPEAAPVGKTPGRLGGTCEKRGAGTFCSATQ